MTKSADGSGPLGKPVRFLAGALGAFLGLGAVIFVVEAVKQGSVMQGLSAIGCVGTALLLTRAAVTGWSPRWHE